MPFFRVLIIGGASHKNIYELLFSHIPDILFIFFVLLSYQKLINGIREHKKVLIIWLGIVIMGSVVGYFNFHSVLPIIYGLEITYFPFITYFISSQYYREEKALFLKWWNVYVVLYTVISVLFHLFFLDLETKLAHICGHEMSEYFIPRTGGFLLTPVPFAIMISFSIFYYIEKILLSENNNYINWLFLAILLIGLPYSVTRAGLVGFWLILIYLIIRTKAYLKISQIGILAFVLMFLVFQSWRPIIWLFSSSSETVLLKKGVSRVELWKKSYQSYKRRPIWGYGIGATGAGAIKFFKGDDINAVIYTTDGWYIKLLNEIGIIGSGIFLLLFYYIIDKAYFLTSDKYIYEGAVFLFVIIVGFFNNVLDFFMLNTLVYFLLSKSKIQ